MLDEGVNLVECQNGIFISLTSSERLQIQRIGRLLRHKEPIIHLYYYKNTREEEIMCNIINLYNS